MDEKTLADELLPQLRAIARDGEIRWITQVELMVGSLYGVTAESLAQRLESLFEDTEFEDVRVRVMIVSPEQEVKAPNMDARMTANGWELLVVKIEGSR